MLRAVGAPAVMRGVDTLGMGQQGGLPGGGVSWQRQWRCGLLLPHTSRHSLKPGVSPSPRKQSQAPSPNRGGPSESGPGPCLPLLDPTAVGSAPFSLPSCNPFLLGCPACPCLLRLRSNATPSSKLSQGPPAGAILHPLGFGNPVMDRGPPSCVGGFSHPSQRLSHTVSPRVDHTGPSLGLPQTGCSVSHVGGVGQRKGGREESHEGLGASPDDRQSLLPHEGQKGRSRPCRVATG